MVINFERAAYKIARKVATVAKAGGPDAAIAQAWLDKRRFAAVNTSGGTVVLRVPPSVAQARLFGLTIYHNAPE